MANFIEKTLEPGEEVIFKGRLHWSYNFKYTFMGIAAILLSIGLVIVTTMGESEGSSSWITFYIIIGLVGLLTIGIGYFLRSRTEFAVTNSRFIQKDGILNIKMTEIPLFKVETVNFYQTLFERMFNTGSIELVGSGGTAHRVEYVQQPYKVRNLIATYMKEQQVDDVPKAAPASTEEQN